MKTYKLIKEYPGSPSLGTIAKKSKSHGAIEFKSPKGKLHYSGSDAINFFENLVSNHPEFWEEVIEKDYELLAFNDKGRLRVVTLHEDDKVTLQPNPDPDSLKWLLKEGYEIHSVKRLSDGGVFTVGDKVILGTIQITIKEFYTTDDHLIWCVSSKGTKLNLKSVQHVKQLLFTTEDGVDIYENQNCFYVRQKLEKVELFYCSKDFWQGNLDIYKWFSTKEKAEEYIINNKPCLSIQEVMNNIEFNPHWSVSEFLKIIRMNLETKVKQKISYEI